MRPFTVGDLQELVRPREGPCVSLFMPTHRLPQDGEQDRIRFRNLRAQARDRMAETAGKRTATKVMKPLDDLEGSDLWRNALDGFAAFASPAGLRWYRVPMEMPERLVVGDSFHVRPLVRFLQTRRRYHVLTLGRKGCRLFACSGDDIRLHDTPEMPASVEEVAGEPQDREGLRYHAAGGGAVRFHGDSAPRSEREDLARYLRRVDAVVADALRDDLSPIVIAGVSRFLAVYRSVSRNGRLALGEAAGNFDKLAPEAIRAKVEPIAQAALRTREDEIVSEYHRAARAGLTTDELASVGAAAVQGRLRTLILGRGKRIPGVFDRETGEIRAAGKSKDALAEDALDDVAEAVLVRGGEVVVLEKDRLPTKQATAAILRW